MQKLLYIGTGFCCAFPERAKTPLSRPNKAVPSSKQLRSLIGDVKYAIADLAAAGWAHWQLWQTRQT